MNFKPCHINQSLNKSYWREHVSAATMADFKRNYLACSEACRQSGSRELLKAYLKSLLSDTYGKAFGIVEQQGHDHVLVLNSDFQKDASFSVIMLLEADGDLADLCRKAIQYYMTDRLGHTKEPAGYIMMINLSACVIFDLTDFERIFCSNVSFLEKYKQCLAAGSTPANKKAACAEQLRTFIENSSETISYTYFKWLTPDDFSNLTDCQQIALYKLFSPEHLLKLPFKYDSNSLNVEFYGELLHILGLQEVKRKSLKLIARLPEKKRHDGSLIENIITTLVERKALDHLSDLERFGEDKEEQLFGIALELCFVWLNRILFSKFFEGLLTSYNKDKNLSDYQFFNSKLIGNFEQLDEFFSEVLPLEPSERPAALQGRFANIPQLNNALFALTPIEQDGIRIKHLDNDKPMPVYEFTAVQTPKACSTGLAYLLFFLDCYDFSGSYQPEIQQKPKPMINSAVLGLIFEKLNGYKEGSYFTPGFITMYMSRQVLRQAVLNKFVETNLELFKDLKDFSALCHQINRLPKKAANAIINSLKICDPAVGSGHFLVSVLNELIAIKSELGILIDRSGDKPDGLVAEVVDDELYVSINGEPFVYDYSCPESQRIQELLFCEKQTIIENCLFGVDINPKSVNISRLRLSMELLKNSYYLVSQGEIIGQTPAWHLQTLPNIEINIKTGNALISTSAVSSKQVNA